MSSTGPVASPASQLSSLLGRFDRPMPPRDGATAAALIPLDLLHGEPHVLLIERATRPGDPGSGQIALPGGHVDPADADLLATAMRETEEEVGLRPEDLLTKPVFVTVREARVFRVQVAVFAAVVRPGTSVTSSPRPEEVRSTFWLPRSALQPAERVERTTPSGPVTVDATLYRGHVLWGFTRGVLLDFFGDPSGSPAVPPTSAAAER